ncbi:hypothetical protein CHU98_g388 [Xylaria longipes]|nr:hypothetical protein CHU98_g388 [Xylaria longipes]
MVVAGHRGIAWEDSYVGGTGKAQVWKLSSEEGCGLQGKSDERADGRLAYNERLGTKTPGKGLGDSNCWVAGVDWAGDAQPQGVRRAGEARRESSNDCGVQDGKQHVYVSKCSAPVST